MRDSRFRPHDKTKKALGFGGSTILSTDGFNISAYFGLNLK